MGGAYGIGYVSAILEYARMNGIEGVVFDFVANFAPYQPDQLCSIYGIDFFQFSHSNDYVAGNARMHGAHMMDTSGDERQNHSIFDFWNQVMNLPSGEYTVKNGKIVPK